MYRFQTMRKKLPSYAISFISKLETYIPKFGMYIPKFATYIPKFGMENSYGVKNFFQEGEIKISVALKRIARKNYAKVWRPKQKDLPLHESINRYENENENQLTNNNNNKQLINS